MWRMRGFLVGAVITIAATGSGGPESFEFTFWPGAAAKRDPRFVAMQDAACGPTARARVRSMPTDSPKEAFQSEPVFELMPNGTFAKRWHLPVDAQPYGLNGTELFFRLDGQYSVTTRGRIRPLPDKPNSEESKWIACGHPPGFERSSYMVCVQLTDETTKKPRKLAFQAPCS